MTVYNELNKIAYIGSSEQTLYPIPFEYISTDDIKVSVYTSNNEFVEDWTYSIQYVIEGGNVKVLSGYNIDNTKKLLILRSVDLIQDNKYREGGDFPAKSTETSFDKLTMITQQLQETLDRCVKVEVLDNQTPEELLQTVYDKLDSATEIAGDAISAANQAQTAADNATTAVNSAEQTLVQTQAYVDSAKVEIDNTKNTAINTINSTVTQAKADVNSAVSTAESTISSIVSDAEGSITNIAVTEANKAIADAAAEATATAKANVDAYVDGTVKPSLQTYVDQTQADANSAATSMQQAALSATAASNYASNASADADNSAESAGLAANSAAAAAESEGKAAEYLQQVSDKITVIEGAVGDIGFAPLGIDETQNKRRYLNGQVISQTQFATFTTKVKAAIALYPSLSTTETNWQAEVTNSKLGQCGKFVIDNTAGTIRLPKVVNINGLQDLSLLGGIKAESLPNINGKFGNFGTWGGAAGTKTGALSESTSNYQGEIGVGSSSFYTNNLDFKASNSSSTYQDNAPVQQEAVQYPYFIQVATGSEESVDVSTEIQLNNPFFFGMHIWSDTAISNASWLISNGSYHSGATYASFYQWLLKIHNGTLTVDGVSVKAYGASDITDYDYVINTADTTFRLPVKVKLASGIETSSSGLKLYFYVGETVQDANVINAAGVLTDIATLKGYDYVVESYKNGTEWYRIYKSGWVEQGGIADHGSVGYDWNQIVTLLKEFRNTNYIVLTDCLYGSGGGQMSYHGQKTTSAFKIYQSSKLNAAGGSRYVNWYACGQGE